MMQMANENLKAQKIYGKYIKELPQVTEVNDTDDIIIEDSTPITSRAKLGVLFDSIKKRIESTWRFTKLNNKTIVEYASELNKNIIKNTDEQQIYTLYGGQVKVVSGTMAVNIAMNIGYAKLFSVEQLKNWFGDDYAASRLGIKTYNGDDVAQEVHFYAPEIWNGEIFQYFYPTNHEGNMRVNYRLEYVYPSTQ